MIPMTYALELAAGIVELRASIPVLSCVRLERAPDADRLWLYGTDLDAWLSATVGPVRTEGEAGAVAIVPLDALRRAVKQLPKGAVPVLSFAPDVLTVSGGRAVYRIPTLPAADFPERYAAGTDASTRIDADDLRRVFELCLPAVSTEETRFYLNGIHVEHDPKAANQLIAVATDGHRLAAMPFAAALYQVAPSVAAKAFRADIWPQLLCRQAAKVLAGKFAPGDVLLRQGKNRSGNPTVALDFGAFLLGQRAIDGTFPDWRRVVPTSGFRHQVALPIAETGEAVAAVLAASDGKSAPAVSLAWGPFGVQLHHQDAEGLSGQAFADTTPAKGAPFAVGLNGKYLAAALAAIAKATGSTTATLRVVDHLSPMVFNSEGEAFYVIMPMRTGFGLSQETYEAEEAKRNAEARAERDKRNPREAALREALEQKRTAAE